MVGPGWLLHASDFPHDHGGGTEALLHALDEQEAAAVLRGNAEEVYRLGAGVAGG
jgi:predicted TIM-barrel fold metal-dependent hydrolase